MGWKNVKEHYRIGHAVQVTEKGICIGSPYIHDIIVISLDGEITKRPEGLRNEDLSRYLKEMDTDPATLKSLIDSPDRFDQSFSVFTYEGGKIVEKHCEKLGWPNVTHDGDMMYENTFSEYKPKVVHWAKKSASCGIEWRQRRIEELREQIAEIEADRAKCEADLAKLNADYPED